MTREDSWPGLFSNWYIVALPLGQNEGTFKDPPPPPAIRAFRTLYPGLKQTSESIGSFFHAAEECEARGA